MLKEKYEIADNLPDTVAKNKHNIINLSEEIAETNKKIGNMNYYTDKADFLAKTEIGAYGYTAGYSAGTHIFMIHEADGVEEFWNVDEMKKYIDQKADGIGEYIGTFLSPARDDISVLPTTDIKDGDRAILEFYVSIDLRFQEYKWKNGGDPTTTGWFKLGSERDSHHHSQTSGITLNDVARQQDPKIATAKLEAITTASADATAKANTAKQEAITTASTDATTKANTAKQEATTDAKNYTDGKITGITQTRTSIKTIGKTLFGPVSSINLNIEANETVKIIGIYSWTSRIDNNTSKFIVEPDGSAVTWTVGNGTQEAIINVTNDNKLTLRNRIGDWGLTQYQFSVVLEITKTL